MAVNPKRLAGDSGVRPSKKATTTRETGDRAAAKVALTRPKVVEKKPSLAGTQTLVRGLEVVNAVANGAVTLAELATAINLNRSTTHRLASTLVELRYLEYSRNDGYALGPKLLQLGYIAGQQKDLPRVAREQLEALSVSTRDTVHIGILDGNRALYLDKIPGMRRVEISSRIGERHPLRSTGLGKALILDATEQQWREYYDQESRLGNRYDVPLEEWIKRMREYAKHGYAFDLEENEDRIRCVAAPVRGVTGAIVGAISVSSAAQYMDDLRMRGLTFEVKKAADSISQSLGYTPATLKTNERPRKS